jgi:NAD(P)-dependent dehydrogenase (short-subunit alcohol dehydrogenase family)
MISTKMMIRTRAAAAAALRTTTLTATTAVGRRGCGTVRGGRLDHPPSPTGSFAVGRCCSFFGTTTQGETVALSNQSTAAMVVAVVAGGASGLGAAAAKALLQRGARVLVADRNQLAFDSDPDFARYREESDPQSPVLEFCEADVTSPEQVSLALDMAEATFGRSVNASVCCAGIATARRTIGKTGTAHSLEEFAKILNVNTVGTFNVARLSAERMVRSAAPTTADNTKDEIEPDHGCIILTSSIAAYEGQVGQVAYAASKAAVVGMTLPLARDLAAHKIRVVTIVRGTALHRRSLIC